MGIHVGRGVTDFLKAVFVPNGGCVYELGVFFANQRNQLCRRREQGQNDEASKNQITQPMNESLYPLHKKGPGELNSHTRTYIGNRVPRVSLKM